MTLAIEIEDANDNSPVFPAAAYSASIPEGTYGNFNTGPRSLVTVSATDADTTLAFRTISYSITDVSNGGSSLFSINSNSGLITASGTFTYPNQYTITVQATDGTSLTDRR